MERPQPSEDERPGGAASDGHNQVTRKAAGAQVFPRLNGTTPPKQSTQKAETYRLTNIRAAFGVPWVCMTWLGR